MLHNTVNSIMPPKRKSSTLHSSPYLRKRVKTPIPFLVIEPFDDEDALYLGGLGSVELDVDDDAGSEYMEETKVVVVLGKKGKRDGGEEAAEEGGRRGEEDAYAQTGGGRGGRGPESDSESEKDYLSDIDSTHLHRRKTKLKKTLKRTPQHQRRRRIASAGPSSPSMRPPSHGTLLPPQRPATVYDAVAGRITKHGFIVPPTITIHGDFSLRLQRALPPDEVLAERAACSRKKSFLRRGKRRGMDIIIEGGLPYEERVDLPDSELLKAVHQYVADFYERRGCGDVCVASLDETALLVIGVLLEEEVRGALGRDGGAALMGREGEGSGGEGEGEEGSGEEGNGEEGSGEDALTGRRLREREEEDRYSDDHEYVDSD